MDARIEDAIRCAQACHTESDPNELVVAVKTLAGEVRRLQESVYAHRGALCATAAIDGADSDTVLDELDRRWPL